MDSGLNINNVVISGKILSEPTFSHNSYGEDFYNLELGTLRKSGYMDRIIIVISERLFPETNIFKQDKAKITGQIRTYNEIANGVNKLHIVIFARVFELISDEEEFEYLNEVELEGFLCKEPQLRISPLGREICDLMLAVNRMYNKSDYIPCIAWGRNARYSSSLYIGTKIKLGGRIQSREYKKKRDDGELIIKTAYEVSILKIEE